VPVELDELPLLGAPLLPPPAEPPPPEGRTRLPMTFKVTLNGSLPGLLKRKVRAADVSPAGGEVRQLPARLSISQPGSK